MTQTFIITAYLPLLSREAQHEAYTKIIKALRPDLSYFSVYGDALKGGVIEVSVKVRPSAAAWLTQKPQSWFVKDLKRKFTKLKIRPRGELSLFHMIFMEAALHSDSANADTVKDALHWFFNAAGYSYLEEAMILNEEAQRALLVLSPFRDTIVKTGKIPARTLKELEKLQASKAKR